MVHDTKSTKRRIARSAFFIIHSALFILLSGCLRDNADAPNIPTTGNGREAALRISIPGMKTPATRGLDADKEKEVTEIDVVIFFNTGNTLAEHHRIAGSDITAASGGNDWQFMVKNIENSENITAAIIANASLEVAEALDAVKSGGTWVGAGKADFLAALRVGANTKWNTSAGGYWTIPMYGEAVVTGSIYAGNLPTVYLTRMLAKVDVVNSVAPADPQSPADGTFELTAVHIVNRNTAGVVAPKWNETTGVLLTAPQTSANLPSGFDPGTRAWAEGNQLTYTPGTGETSVTDEIYLFESAALSGDPASPDGLRLVLEGNYTAGGVTKNYYYPADFTTPQGAYMPVLRNNRYLFTITEAAGRGYDTMGEAAASFGVVSNLRTSLVVVDESGIKHMVWNGDYFLGVSEKHFAVPVEGGQDIELCILTNYADGWTARVEDAANNTWLTLAGGATTASGTSSDKTLTFDVAAAADEWALYESAILLTAGRLELPVTVARGARIVAETAASYMMDGTTEHSFKVKSNTQWAVRSVDDHDGILLNSASQIAAMLGRTGGDDYTTGDTFAFTLIDDLNATLGAKSFTVVFYDPTGKAADHTATVTGLGALYVGMFGGALQADANGVWQFERTLHIQNADESTGSMWSTYTGGTQGVTDDIDGKGNTYTLATNSYSNPAAELCFQKNDNYASITGKTDANYNWYLPAQKQLMAAWVAHAGFESQYQFIATSYWSATESAAPYAWSVIFINGNTLYYAKEFARPIRCVREISK